MNSFRGVFRLWASLANAMSTQSRQNESESRVHAILKPVVWWAAAGLDGWIVVSEWCVMPIESNWTWCWFCGFSIIHRLSSTRLHWNGGEEGSGTEFCKWVLINVPAQLALSLLLVERGQLAWIGIGSVIGDWGQEYDNLLHLCTGFKSDLVQWAMHRLELKSERTR